MLVRFLLARLYTDLLRGKERKKDVLRILNQLPQGLAAIDDAYDKALKQIDEQVETYRLLAKRAISFITYAQRPLTVDELCIAVSIDTDDDVLDVDVLDIDDIYKIEIVTSVCAGLVTVDEDSSIVRLVHYTAQKYFERVLLEWNPKAQEYIAVTCLTYLSLKVFRSGRCNDNETFEQRLAENLFFDYTAHYWSEHVRPVQSTISSSALGFLRDEHLVDSTAQGALVETKWKWSNYSRRFPSRLTSLHLAAMFGLSFLAEELLVGLRKDGICRSDLKDSFGRTPLSWAAQWGHEAVVKLLVERDDVEADSKDSDGQTPLSWAAASGHEAVVKLLVERDDVEADSKDSAYGQTPLSWAAACGHEAVVKLLVERDDVEADSKDSAYGQTPLSRAAQCGHEAVVKLLESILDSTSIQSQANTPPPPPTT
jgi:hypothetical protein